MKYQVWGPKAGNQSTGRCPRMSNADANHAQRNIAKFTFKAISKYSRNKLVYCYKCPQSLISYWIVLKAQKLTLLHLIAPVDKSLPFICTVCYQVVSSTRQGRKPRRVWIKGIAQFAKNQMHKSSRYDSMKILPLINEFFQEEIKGEVSSTKINDIYFHGFRNGLKNEAAVAQCKYVKKDCTSEVLLFWSASHEKGKKSRLLHIVYPVNRVL